MVLCNLCVILVVISSVGVNVWCVYEVMGVGVLDVVDMFMFGGGVDVEVNYLLFIKIDQIGCFLDKFVVLRLCVGIFVCDGVVFLVVIGVFVGGLIVLVVVFGKLLVEFVVGIVVVQYVDQVFVVGMVEWLNGQIVLKVCVVVEGDCLYVGEVLFVVINDYMYVLFGGIFGYMCELVSMFYWLLVDVFFYSMVEYWWGSVIGVLFMGMGWDGVIGLKVMCVKGYYIIVQDVVISVVYGMFKVVVVLDVVCVILLFDCIVDEFIVFVCV